MDYLRGQMNFYNRRDYRVETAVNLLERWGCLKEAPNKFGYLPITEPSAEQLDRKTVEARLKSQNQKLLEMVRLASTEGSEVLPVIYNYFRA